MAVLPDTPAQTIMRRWEQPLRRWWATRRLRSKGLMILAVPTALLAVALFVLLDTAAAQSQAQVRTRAAATTAAAAQTTLVELLNAETGVRGYVASGDSVLLQPWQWATADLGRTVAALRARPGLSRATGRALGSLVAREMTLLRALVSAAGRSPIDRRALASGLLAGKAVMDRLRRMTGAIAAATQHTIDRERARSSDLRRVATTVAVAGMLIGVLGVLFLFLFLRRVAERIDDVRADARRLGLGEGVGAPSTAGDELGRLSRELAQASKLLASRSLDLVRAHRAAVQAGEDRTRTLSRIGHELRTPLTSILGFGQLLADSDRLGESEHEHAGHVVHAGRHVLALLEEIDDPERDAQVLALDTEPTPIAELARRVCALMRPLADERRIGLEVDLPDGAFVLADRRRLEEVLINLLSNAIKYNRPGGSVSVFAELSVTGLRVCVADTGPGIRADLVPRVFAPFERLEAAEGPVPGAGVGLAVCRTYVEAMGGAIGIDAQARAGARFWFDLPLAPRTMAPEAAA